MNVEITGLDKLRKMFPPDLVRAKLTQTMQSVVLYIASYVKSEKLSGQVLHIRTNRLKSSISGTTQVVGDLIAGRIGTNVVYARIHELGGTILPKVGPYLKFNIGGRWIFATKVKMPARPFMAPSLRENKGFIVQQFQKSIDLMIKGK